MNPEDINTEGGAMSQSSQMPMGDQMPQEEMRKNLLDMYSKIRQKKNELDAAVNVGEANNQAEKIKTLEKFFAEFEKAGIDPSDPQAMRDFFENLYQKNPDLYQMIIPVMDQLLGSPDQEGQNDQQPEEQEVGP